MLSFSSYRAILAWNAPVPAQSFWRHVLRYWLLHMVVWVGTIIVWGVLLSRYVTTEGLSSTFSRAMSVVDELYMSWLVVSYDPAVGVATNMSGPVMWTNEEVLGAIDKHFMTDGTMQQEEWPSNILVIDTTAAVDDFVAYETLFLITEQYLVAGTPTDMRVVPLIGHESEELTPVVIDKQLVDILTTEWSTWIQTHSSEIRRMMFYILWWWALLFLPLLALSITLWLSAGMLLVTLVSRWISKIWVRVWYYQLFTWLSLSYLPIYILLKTLFWSGILPWGGIIGYIAMVGCLAVFIVRAEEHKNLI